MGPSAVRGNALPVAGVGERERKSEPVMFKTQGEQVTVLGVCVEEPPSVEQAVGLDFCSVRSGRRAIDMLRILSFDLTLVGMTIPDITTWDFIRRMRTGWAWQKWALVASQITEQQEITARTFGSIRIFEVMPTGEELLRMGAKLRSKASLTGISRPDDRDYRSASAF
jgi:CheY-like chemotaxis protein